MKIKSLCIFYKPSFKIEFVDFGLYFVKYKNNLIYPLLQVGSGFDEKSTGSGMVGQKSTDPDPHPWQIIGSIN